MSGGSLDLLLRHHAIVRCSCNQACGCGAAWRDRPHWASCHCRVCRSCCWASSSSTAVAAEAAPFAAEQEREDCTPQQLDQALTDQCVADEQERLNQEQPPEEALSSWRAALLWSMGVGNFPQWVGTAPPWLPGSHYGPEVAHCRTTSGTCSGR